MNQKKKTVGLDLCLLLSTCSLLKNVLVDGSRSLSDAMSQTRKTKIHGVIEGFRTLLIYRVSQEESARLREGVPYVKVYRYNPKHLCPNLNGYGDDGQRSLKL